MKTSIAVLADLHLTNNEDTVQYFCFEWTLKKLEEIKPDMIILAGDITAAGNEEIAVKTMNLLKTLDIPIISTPGNAEIRNPETAEALQSLFSEKTLFENDNIVAATFDTSRSEISEDEKQFLIKKANETGDRKLVLCTHVAISKLKDESRKWLEEFVTGKNIALISAHRHFDKEFEFNGSKIFKVRGLDPEKAIGAPPAFALFEIENGNIAKNDIVFQEAVIDNWSVQEKDEFLSNLGLAFLSKDEILTDIDYAISEKIPCVELRDCAANIDRKSLSEKIKEWRETGGKILSWHMPNIKWNPEKNTLDGIDAWRKTTDAFMELGGDRITVHPPYVPVGKMEKGDLIRNNIANIFTELLRPFKDKSIPVGIENLHMGSSEVPDETRRFGYLPEELKCWRDELAHKLHYDKIGFVLDLGHARNNMNYSSEYTLGEWFSALNNGINAYHAHQTVATENGKKNHFPIEDVFGPLISFSALFCAWKRKQISRAPIFIEVRGKENRSKSYSTLKNYFDQK
jgi:sugar phosphate isomerase/epimerase/predicted phosphodiesterase